MFKYLLEVRPALISFDRELEFKTLSMACTYADHIAKNGVHKDAMTMRRETAWRKFKEDPEKRLLAYFASDTMQIFIHKLDKL